MASQGGSNSLRVALAESAPLVRDATGWLQPMAEYANGALKRHDESTDDELSAVPTLTPPSVRVEPGDEWFPEGLLKQARDVVMSDDADDVVTVESEDFEVSPSMLRATLWNARTGDPLTDVYAPAGKTEVVEIAVEKTIALGGNVGPRLASDAGRGIVSIQIEAAVNDGVKISNVSVRTEERDTNPESRPPVCECESGDALPCESCFLEGFNRPDN